MPIPKYDELTKPLLAATLDGLDHRMSDVERELSTKLGLGADELSAVTASGDNLFNKRLWWARTFLVKAGVLQSTGKGIVAITDRGRALFAEDPPDIKAPLLRRYPEFVAFEKRSNKPAVQSATGTVETSQELPEAEVDTTDPALSILRDATENQSGQFWWVNQGATYREERAAGELRAPRVNRTGRPLEHHVNVSLVQPGDIVLNYANGSIRAIGVAGTPSHPATEDGTDYVALIDYTDLLSPIALQTVPQSLRVPANGPFTQDGAVTQTYLTKISPSFVTSLLARLTNQRRAPATNVEAIEQQLRERGFRLPQNLVARYHFSLHTRNFVVLAGLSGSGKTWLTEAYADAMGARYLLVPVAPNWTTNEDLLGYLNPVDGKYYHTDFSRYLMEAADERDRAQSEDREPRPFHAVLDEMNLARVEYYFAKILSLMEVRSRRGLVRLQLSSELSVGFGRNVFVIGTVNIDETTFGFADKVLDRAQVIEIQVPRDAVVAHIGDRPYAAALLAVWDAICEVAPFAYRVIDEVVAYVAEAEALNVPWQRALDELILQKILPKIRGTDHRTGLALNRLTASVSETQTHAPLTAFPLSLDKARHMRDGFQANGFASYF